MSATDSIYQTDPEFDVAEKLTRWLKADLFAGFTHDN
jgi:hypothetical protein